MTGLSAEQDFSTHFHGAEVLPSSQGDLMRSVYALRFQVYCIECGFLDQADFPNGQEVDEHDENSAHFVAVNLEDEVAGYVRLVSPDAIHTFPFQNHCVSLLAGAVLPPASQSAEISRLMVRHDYRRRAGELPPIGGLTAKQGADLPNERRAPSPQILLSMYRQMYAHSVQNGIRYWYAAMERSLARALGRLHFGFRQIGPATDYYGPVAPYVADLRVLEMQLSQHNPALLSWMRSTPEPL
jgi:N-acyl amino acid synthase of PEP-CTERM/exosortase system